MPINPFLQFLEEEPKAGYFSYQDQWRTPNQKKWFQSQFDNIQNQYMGKLGQQGRTGQDPNLRFMDFLKNFDWSQTFREQNPQGVSRYNPWTKWLI